MSIETNKLMNLADGKVLYDDLRGRSEANKSMIAPAFAEGTANSAGSYVTYEGGLYLLPNGHTANVTWANTTKTAVTVGGDLSALKNEITSKQDSPSVAGTAGQVLALDSNLDPVWSTPQSGSEIDDSAGSGVKNKTWSANKLTKIETDFETVTGNDLIEFIDGYYIATNKSAGSTVSLTPQEGSGTSSYAIIDCLPGDIFTLNGTGGSTGRLFCFIDSDNKCIYTAAENLSYTNTLIQAPPNTAKLILNVVTTTKGMCCKNASIDLRVDDLENNLLPNDLGKGAVLISGKYIDYRDGDLTNSSTALATARINISGCTKIVYSRICITTSPTAWGMAFYASDGSYISGEKCKVNQASNYYEPTEITVPENAVYIRMTAFNNQLPYVYDADDYYAKIGVTDVKVNGTSCVTNGVASVTVPVTDVQVNGVSVVTDGVAQIPLGSTSTPGVLMASGNGIGITNGYIQISPATSASIKTGTSEKTPIGVSRQHESVFYGLAKIAGADEKNSALSAGTYTESAKSAISQMLNAPETISGTTPSITAKPGVRYVCGEVSTLDITLPASGCVDVVFESGSTATVLTITPPTGVTVKWANGFDPTALDANTTYEINIMDGLGVACAWT